jgi:hypothetical protein
MSRTARPDAGQPSPSDVAGVATTLRAIAILAALALTVWLLSSIVLLVQRFSMRLSRGRVCSGVV